MQSSQNEHEKPCQPDQLSTDSVCTSMALTQVAEALDFDKKNTDLPEVVDIGQSTHVYFKP